MASWKKLRKRKRKRKEGRREGRKEGRREGRKEEWVQCPAKNGPCKSTE